VDYPRIRLYEERIWRRRVDVQVNLVRLLVCGRMHGSAGVGGLAYIYITEVIEERMRVQKVVESQTFPFLFDLVCKTASVKFHDDRRMSTLSTVMMKLGDNL
jgi:hypothetical protein